MYLRPTACVITVKKTQAQQQLQQQQQQQKQQHTAPTNASLTILRSCLSHVKPITSALPQTLQTGKKAEDKERERGKEKEEGNE